MDAKVNVGKQMEIFNFHDTFNTDLYAGEIFTPDFFLFLQKVFCFQVSLTIFYAYISDVYI
jgi:hypothetical protein